MIVITPNLPKGWKASPPDIQWDEKGSALPQDLWQAALKERWVIDIEYRDSKFICQVVAYKTIKRLAKDEFEARAILKQLGLQDDDQKIPDWERPICLKSVDNIFDVRDFIDEWLTKLSEN